MNTQKGISHSFEHSKCIYLSTRFTKNVNGMQEDFPIVSQQVSNTVLYNHFNICVKFTDMDISLYRIVFS